MADVIDLKDVTTRTLLDELEHRFAYAGMPRTAQRLADLTSLLDRLHAEHQERQ